jgi:hypothetical protein
LTILGGASKIRRLRIVHGRPKMACVLKNLCRQQDHHVI